MMDHAMIGKIKKAKVYAEERADRIVFESLRVRLQGDNNESPHIVEYDHGQWHCGCDFFAARGRCSHSMAIERILQNMVELAQDN
jgi:hypothetical protein